MNNAMLLNAHLTDKELVERVKSGNKSCFEVLVRRHCHALYRMGRMYGFAHNEAEALLLCAFAEAYGCLQKFRGKISFRTWLARKMINGCMAVRRENKSNGELFCEPAAMARRSAQHYDTGRYLMSQEMAGNMEACMEQLPVSLRSVYILSEIDGYSIAETALLLSATEENIKFRLERAKTSLRKSLRRWYNATEIYSYSTPCCDRMVQQVMGKIHSSVSVPLGVPTS